MGPYEPKKSLRRHYPSGSQGMISAVGPEVTRHPSFVCTNVGKNSRKTKFPAGKSLSAARAVRYGLIFSGWMMTIAQPFPSDEHTTRTVRIGRSGCQRNAPAVNSPTGWKVCPS